ncbi:MAG: ABC transporter ATP-binding protein, partial [Candidatus Limnocylindrales bacterium]
MAASVADRAPDVEILDVTKHFGAVVAVDQMTLRIARGEFYSFLGPSGCGKTTTLRMIAGFEQPSAGEILLEGQPIAGVPPYRRNVNTVFQHYALFPHMDVAQNVGYGLRQKGIKGGDEKRRVSEALDLVRLGGYERRRTWEMSGGQQQRVALARALVNHPTVLLLDEPLGALDRQLRHEMQLELKALQREVGITFVYVTHDQEEALTMSDVIVVLRDGRIQQQGSPSELYERPVNRFVADFIGSSNFLTATVEAAEAGRATVKSEQGLVLRGRVTDRDATLSVGDRVTVAIRPERME